MYTFCKQSAALRTPWCRFAACLALAMAITGAAYATEGGASVYPAGVETVMPGMMPGPGGSLLAEFDNFYQANNLVGSNGQSLMPGFHLRVGAVAGKGIHNWGIHVLGGTLVSVGAVPVVYIHLDAPFGHGDKVGIGNMDITPAAIAYAKGAMHFWYGLDVLPPGLSYHKGDLVNVGQHNWATAPAGAFTYLPNHAKEELSSRFEYFVNYTDPATNYRSGNEFLWEYDGMQNVTKKLAVGGNGYFYKQTTDDLLNGLMYLDGNRGRNLAFGPEIRYHLGHTALILKYQRDFLTQNRPVGNSFWFQIGVPIGGPHHD